MKQEKTSDDRTAEGLVGECQKSLKAAAKLFWHDDEDAAQAAWLGWKYAVDRLNDFRCAHTGRVSPKTDSAMLAELRRFWDDTQHQEALRQSAG